MASSEEHRSAHTIRPILVPGSELRLFQCSCGEWAETANDAEEVIASYKAHYAIFSRAI